MASSTLKTLHPWLQENDTQTESGALIKSYSHDNGTDDIFCIVHGYPQTSYMWRRVIETWKPHATLFIPELPGYGTSTLPTSELPPSSSPSSLPSYTKRTIGLSILQALHLVLPTSPTRKIHWISHDRGARIGHRLLTSPSPSPNLSSAVLIDIVPTLEQWRSFANPAAATAYFHWPFLATPSAPQVIEAMGGESFTRMILARGRGSNVAGARKIDEDDAYAHYAAVFSRREAIRGSCADYADGSVRECAEQEREQAEGSKVRVPVLVVYSRGSLGAMHDVEGVWRGWVGEGTRLEFEGVGEGHGHYLPESADGVVAGRVLEFIRGL